MLLAETADKYSLIWEIIIFAFVAMLGGGWFLSKAAELKGWLRIVLGQIWFILTMGSILISIVLLGLNR